MARYHLGVFSTIREFIKENHRTDQEVERPIAGNIPDFPVKRKKEQHLREERIATVVGRHGTIPLEDYLRGIAHNMHFTSCRTVVVVEDSDTE